MVIKRQFNSLFFLFLYLNVILLIIKNILFVFFMLVWRNDNNGSIIRE